MSENIITAEFIEQHEHTLETSPILLTFLKSIDVKAYPCGRRRSESIIKNDKVSEKYFLPFDPEARLNTEFNNTRHNSLNGYTQSYINELDEDKKFFTFAINGYTFTINITSADDIDSNVNVIDLFGTKLASSLGDESSKKIYANIKLEEIPLYSRVDSISSEETLLYNTWVLRNQSASSYATPELDLLRSAKGNEQLNISNVNEYYFSGVSFSTRPITEDAQKSIANSSACSYKFIQANDLNRAQYEFSLCILLKDDNGQWVLNEEAKLPRVLHGETENSVKVGHISAESIKYNGHPVAAFDMLPVEEDDKTYYQLHLYNAE